MWHFTYSIQIGERRYLNQSQQLIIVLRSALLLALVLQEPLNELPLKEWTFLTRFQTGMGEEAITEN